MTSQFVRFADTICASSEDAIRSDVTLGGRLILEQSGQITISYAPFEHIQLGARIVIVGITPGAQQAANALLEARRHLLAGSDHETALRAAKVFASFSGLMRDNLVEMLDHIGLHRWLGIATTAELWGNRSDLAHFTSALRFPVFVGSENYRGSPKIEQTALLVRLINDCLRVETESLREAVWVPLGGVAEAGVKHLVRGGHLDPRQVLTGLLHPSGSNNERIAYFVGRKPRDALSNRTNATLIDAGRERLSNFVAGLKTA